MRPSIFHIEANEMISSGSFVFLTIMKRSCLSISAARQLREAEINGSSSVWPSYFSSGKNSVQEGSPPYWECIFALREEPGPVLQARLIFFRLSVKNVGDCGGAQSQFVDYIADTYAVLFHDGFLLPNVLLLSLYISF